MLKAMLDDIKYKWNKVEIVDRIALFVGLMAIILLIQPIRTTMIIICLVYLALYTGLKIYKHIKHKRGY